MGLCSVWELQEVLWTTLGLKETQQKPVKQSQFEQALEEDTGGCDSSYIDSCIRGVGVAAGQKTKWLGGMAKGRH